MKTLAMKIAILDDFQDCVRTLNCFAKLKGHEVLILNQHYGDPQELARRLQGVQALVDWMRAFEAANT